LRAIATAGLVAGLAELVLIGLANAGFGQVLASGIAAVGVGLIATLISIRRHAPALVMATAGIMPMLPGLAIFRAVFSFAVDGDFNNGLRQMLAAIAIALALGSGVVLGEFLGSPLRYRAGRVGDFIRKEGPPGLRRAVGRVVRLRPAENQQTLASVARDREVLRSNLIRAKAWTPPIAATCPATTTAKTTSGSAGHFHPSLLVNLHVRSLHIPLTDPPIFRDLGGRLLPQPGQFHGTPSR
jgi:uncharacterized membrane protein YjjB (DUF3815 family)